MQANYQEVTMMHIMGFLHHALVHLSKIIPPSNTSIDQNSKFSYDFYDQKCNISHLKPRLILPKTPITKLRKYLHTFCLNTPNEIYALSSLSFCSLHGFVFKHDV
jgi:hypothetical protein